ncbi:MAG: hypothetical protein J6B01_01580 [Ruminococcus sp.]|nr:hypothetical protein [Ruminococcus sp.]
MKKFFICNWLFENLPCYYFKGTLKEALKAAQKLSNWTNIIYTVIPESTAFVDDFNDFVSFDVFPEDSINLNFINEALRATLICILDQELKEI